MKHFRLALVRQKYRPDGGAERFVSRALEALEDQDLDLSVITREWQGDVNPNWHIHLCDPMKWGRVSRERGFANAARKIWQQEKFDIVQSHERIPGCDIYRAGDGVHRRWLLQRSRLLPAWRGKRLLTDRFHSYVMRAEQEMYAAPELKSVICNAQMIKNEIMADFGLPDEKITVIYNAIDNQKFLPATEALRHQLRQQFNIPQQAHCLIFVGSGFERKGLEAAIRAVAPTNSILLVVGQDKDEKRYRGLAQSLGCEQRIRFMGVQKQTLPFYQAADALLLPTLYDPFPNVILEAMSCGLPVITSQTCGGAEFIQQGVNGFVFDALDVKSLAESIQELPVIALGSDMAEAARARIIEETPARLSGQLLDLYRRILD
ncbi:MAG: glycosyltransferase family 4 protein [Ewingella americana]|jgi:UDP-glucose:(heptosyl)LPS alpha-1,3-glucosyltransferase|uniref:glycosyltransferase family 4 protein n=1 Tax=Ewingella americana TaxID=41202 RepID=UPI00242B5877|nr:glycosyltransferase family 4 protein [Ewingella americana]MCI1680493.1 glycosyltransferase family 4 protein [Ewingella americana]MCI1856343.1 glycosyltransferase family 4 protein [Ewingella americana]MCI1863940.1 glycosyltransferase family 4 protein [Ewingella americana]MCI2143022.1 glycosyltransferase family 4 protein [Ewingella americana]MCI2163907.1 glycosyltransferase family 4 protein [Ewingella americana]